VLRTIGVDLPRLHDQAPSRAFPNPAVQAQAATRREIQGEQADRVANPRAIDQRVPRPGGGVDVNRMLVWRPQEAWRTAKQRGPHSASLVRRPEYEPRLVAEELRCRRRDGGADA